ncbi:MAG: sulfurtransferase TusA family protein [Actinomycetota bacterium]
MNAASDREDPIEVDARGLRCPLPVIRLAEAARQASAGARIVVLASDPATRYDIPAWCRMRGHELLEVAEVPQAGVSETPLVPASSHGGHPQAERMPQAYLRFLIRLVP